MVFAAIGARSAQFPYLADSLLRMALRAPPCRLCQPYDMMMKMMKTNILNAPGELFLGADLAAAKAQGPRYFRNSGNAVRFAMEQAAPVHLRGALLKVDGQTFGPAQIAKLHHDLMSQGKKIRGL